MTSILQTCTPRKELLDGTFNPEIFTASLRPVVSCYREKQTSEGSAGVNNIYADAKFFFEEATFPKIPAKAHPERFSMRSYFMIEITGR